MSTEGEKPDHAPLYEDNVDTGVDVAQLQDIIEAVECFLDENGKIMLPQKKAKLIAAIYNLFSVTGRRAGKNDYLTLIKSAA